MAGRIDGPFCPAAPVARLSIRAEVYDAPPFRETSTVAVRLDGVALKSFIPIYTRSAAPTVIARVNGWSTLARDACTVITVFESASEVWSSFNEREPVDCRIPAKRLPLALA